MLKTSIVWLLLFPHVGFLSTLEHQPMSLSGRMVLMANLYAHVGALFLAHSQPKIFASIHEIDFGTRFVDETHLKMEIP